MLLLLPWNCLCYHARCSPSPGSMTLNSLKLAEGNGHHPSELLCPFLRRRWFLCTSLPEKYITAEASCCQAGLEVVTSFGLSTHFVWSFNIQRTVSTRRRFAILLLVCSKASLPRASWLSLVCEHSYLGHAEHRISGLPLDPNMISKTFYTFFNRLH